MSRVAIGVQHVQPIQTLIEPASRFFPAGDKHQDYYSKNRGSEYCRTVIAPHLSSAGLEE
ncbi:MAG: peptide-methionine (S)-S-oxide reductase [Planctomycetota bacterium]|jgi:peptide-methionine (S)-S-oxide reductase